MNKQLLIFPLIAFGMVAVFAFRGLSINGQAMPSVLIGLDAPAVELDKIPRYPGPFDPSEFEGEVTLVNVWGSWCVYCLYEHPVLLRMAEEGVQIYGLAWNDTPEAAAKWLDQHGSPFTAVGLDQTGRAVAEFGVTGAPETFILDKAGKVRYRHVGPITDREWQRRLKPLVRDLEAEAPAEPAS
ncbi:DsbE family thiol:disulfide interchange protein [Parvularcula lutaonensis]|uniref:DsbE family thiol:disulfide interchange protein n=1 Tax=Parvularcula lutaonensis TaxID=491923 RepID=A0ABV7MBL5_9PROT|nr:DsbE family thiol:disulfide interchange protein [Parvularcula lutaonensis]